eukprot:2791447-Alexandrium_andersonii.AAC.1
MELVRFRRLKVYVWLGCRVDARGALKVPEVGVWPCANCLERGAQSLLLKPRLRRRRRPDVDRPLMFLGYCL